MRKISKEEFSEILKKHEMWLQNDPNGKQANLSGANLSEAILSEANLSRADLSGAILSGANLSRANLTGAYLSRANLSGAYLLWANLSQANLSEADLSGANIDYSVLPLWCGSLNAGFDDKQIKQIAYHMVKAGLNSKNTSEETRRDLIKMIDFANEFHRVEECGIITYEVEI